MENQRMEYKSLLSSFMSWDEWLRSTRTPAEFDACIQDNYPTEKQRLYELWLADQKITEHLTYENDVLVTHYIYNVE